jgi:hypothetical protein
VSWKGHHECWNFWPDRISSSRCNLFRHQHHWLKRL